MVLAEQSPGEDERRSEAICDKNMLFGPGLEYTVPWEGADLHNGTASTKVQPAHRHINTPATAVPEPVAVWV